MANWYVSSVAYKAVQKWSAIGPSQSVTLGTFCRQSGAAQFAGWSGDGAGSTDVATINFGATSFVMTVPTGYTAWDNSGTTTFDPSNKGANITLSNGNLTATRANGSAWQSVRSTTSKTSGKWYFEVTVTTLSGSSTQMVGLCNSSASMSNFLGSDTNGEGYQSNGGGQNLPASWQGVTASHTVGIAVDIDNGLCWAHTDNSTNWNNQSYGDPTSANELVGYIMSSILAIGSERVFVVTTAGTTGSAEPTWSLNDGATTNESGHGGTAVWTECAGHESRQSAGNWTAPIYRLTNLPGGQNAIGGLSLSNGDTIFVSSDHVEAAQSFTSGFTISVPADCMLLSVTRGGSHLPPVSADLTRGAQAYCSTNNTLTFQMVSANYVWGVDLIALNNFNLRCNFGAGEMDNCTVQPGQNLAGQVTILNGGGTVVWTNTPLKGGTSINSIGISLNGSFEWRNTSSAIQGTPPPGSLFGQGSPSWVKMHGLDLSGLAANCICSSDVTPGGDILLRDCKLASTTKMFDTGTGWSARSACYGQFMVDNCDNSVNYRMAHSNFGGAVQTNTTVYRSGGNSDGTTSFSWQLINGSSTPLTIGSALRLPEVQKRVNTTGVSKTLTFYGMSSRSTIPTNAEVWVEVDYLGDSTSPKATLVTSRVADALTAGTNLTADTSNWTGGVSARQNSHSYNVGDLMVPTGNSTRVFICTVAGTSAGSEPGGYASAVDGGTVSDGGATFQAMFRWVLTVSFTQQLAGSVKAIVATTLSSGMSTTANLFFIDPQFTLT